MQQAAELVRVARRMVWFKPPVEALENTVLFLAHLMTYGTIEDVVVARRHFSPGDFRHALERAPAGVFDPRSWAYWNTVLGRVPVPPLPRRKLIQEQQQEPFGGE